jgi:hypothetical protein
MGAKVVLHLHEPMPELFDTMFPAPGYAWLRSLIKWSERLSIAFADRVLTVTQRCETTCVLAARSLAR